MGAGSNGIEAEGLVRAFKDVRAVVTARAMAARDIGSGIALVGSRDPRPAIAARILYHLSDAVLFGRGRPKVAASALGFAALGIAGLRAR